MYEKYGQFIDGKWQKSSSGETYDVINPATEEVIGKASKANSEDIQKALKSAEKGLKIWRNTSPWERSKIIRKISELMKQRVNVLSSWLTLEVGKPLTEGPGEIGVRLIYLNGTQRKLKEFLEKLIRVVFQIQKFM